MSTQKKKLKIYQEEAKTRQTSHWDLDYMRTEEVDALLNAARDQGTNQPGTAERIRWSHLGIGVLLLAVLSAGIFTLIRSST